MSRERLKVVAMTGTLTTILLAQFVMPLSKAFPHLGGGVSNPRTNPARTLAATERPPEHVVAILTRACADCHTNETRWPWYSHIAPVSWLVVDEANHGREHVNFSNWAAQTDSTRRLMLRNICTRVRDGEMPPARYLTLHRDARMTVADRATLCAWSDSALSRLR